MGDSTNSETGRIFKKVASEITATKVKKEKSGKAKKEEEQENRKVAKKEEKADLEEGEIVDDAVEDDGKEKLPSSRKRSRAAPISTEEPPASDNKRFRSDSLPDLTSPSEVFDVQEYKVAPTSSSSSSTSSSGADDSRLLDLLFSKSGVASALNHDSIVDSSSAADAAIAERLAKKVADQAVAALLKSRESLKSAPIGAPTWTGRFGQAGAPGKKFGNVSRGGTAAGSSSNLLLASASTSSPAFAPSDARHFNDNIAGFRSLDGSSASSVSSSSDLLDRMRNRAAITSSAVSGIDGSSSSLSSLSAASANQRSKSLLHDLRSYLLKHEGNGGVKSDVLIKEFESRCETEQDQFVFRQMLRRVASLVKQNEGTVKRWRLKPEFRT